MTISDGTIDQIEAYYALLNHWNKKINLTALPLEAMSDGAIDRILVEPLVAAEAVPASSSVRWLDLGSGGGSPAIPIKIVRPLAELTLVEARSRKAAFLREAVRELSLSTVVVIDDRFEVLAGRPGWVGIADLVTARAVRTDAVLLDSSHRLLKVGGELFLFTIRSNYSLTTPRFRLSRTLALTPGSEAELVVLEAH